MVKKNNNNNDEIIDNIDDNEIVENIDNDVLLKELLKNQIQTVNITKKLSYNDIKRISKFIKTSIFCDNCSLWNGYITNEKNQTKGTYINFYYNKKKIALHRLLYVNFVGEIADNEYIKFSCNNKGKCCSIYHMNKYTYTTKENLEQDNIDTNTHKSDTVQINRDKKKLTIEI